MKAKNTPVSKAENKESDVSQVVQTPFPKDIKPMLATLVDEPAEEAGWLYEVKWDGFRALGYVHEGTIEIKSRNNKSFNEKVLPCLYRPTRMGERYSCGWRNCRTK